MNKCESCVQAIKRMCIIAEPAAPLLPPEYQQVEYLQSSSTTYILTGFYPNQQFITEIKGSYNSSGSSMFIGGCYYLVNSKSKTGSYGITHDTSNRTNFMCPSSANNGASYTWLQIPQLLDNNVHIFTDNHIDFYYAVDDKVTNITNYFLATNAAQYSLFGRNGNYNGDSKQSVINTGIMRIYYAKIYNANRENINYFIPCYRKSDNKPGLYDIVTNTFKTNSGTGEFKLSGYVTEAASNIQAVEYIEATGSQWIDTSIIPVQSDVVTCRFSFTSMANDNVLFYVDSGSYKNRAYGLSISSGLYVAGWGSQSNTFGSVNTDIHTLTINNGVFRIDDVQGFSSSQNPNPTYTLKLAYWDRSGSMIKRGSVRLYSFGIDNKILLTPCYRKFDGKTGMYDTTTSRFYYNQGYEEFTVGGNV